ncbi:hypothetical protein PISMIDRAFT_8263 [Pisolithus microcarpus 441]|uniref:Unplaced genomic scaffold scaffold_12, whole genome shotgun sequence n=1 Tax=Pisolithus microcarpus 441 TaxID=765257 RepID=A0A0C9ZZ32_9AGAM|nr:hypothetical protein PISMIDRAFT_8263 [Pisolithus microcarpus 441]
MLTGQEVRKSHTATLYESVDPLLRRPSRRRHRHRLHDAQHRYQDGLATVSHARRPSLWIETLYGRHLGDDAGTMHTPAGCGLYLKLEDNEGKPSPE